MRTLIADDDFTNRLLLQTFLGRYGECHVTVNGREAVEAFRAARAAGQKYDLVCLDIMMPEMDGHAALRAIREEEAKAGIFSKGAKILMTTALSEGKDVVAAFQGLCDSYLVKPISPVRLLQDLKQFGLVKSGPGARGRGPGAGESSCAAHLQSRRSGSRFNGKP